MAIIRKINGKDVVVAEQTIVSHDDLQGRDSYGAHPISAIRKLPEKLHALKERDSELEGKIAAHDAEVDEYIKTATENISDIEENIDQVEENLSKVEEAASQISLVEDPDNEGKLLFTNYDGTKTPVQGGFLTDDDTVELNDNKRITLKKVYSNQSQIKGIGTEASPFEFTNPVDGETLVIDTDHNKTYATAIKDSEGIITPASIRKSLADIEKDIDDKDKATGELITGINAEITAIKEIDSKQDASIAAINTKLQSLNSVGGYLPANDFGKSVTQDALNNYAVSEIPNVTIDTIPNGTRVKNEYDDHVWIYNSELKQWIDDGIDTVAVATNTTLGVVTGSEEDLEGSIDALGHITINQLPETLDVLDRNISALDTNKMDKVWTSGVVYATTKAAETRSAVEQTNIEYSESNTASTIAIRTAAGTLNVTTPTETLEAANKGYVDSKLGDLSGNVAENIESINKSIDDIEKTITDNEAALSQYKETIQQYHTTNDANLAQIDSDLEQINTNITELQTKTAILKTDGQGANYLSDDGTYKEVVTVTSDDQTIVTSEDKVLTAVGLYDSENDEFRDATTIFNGTSIFLYEPGEVV